MTTEFIVGEGGLLFGIVMPNVEKFIGNENTGLPF